jgi:hypothetical protein
MLATMTLLPFQKIVHLWTNLAFGCFLQAAGALSIKIGELFVCIDWIQICAVNFVETLVKYLIN